MKLSILTPSIPDRMSHLHDLRRMTKHEDVEWLVLIDNKLRSIGKKRQALLELAQGDYIMFLDDDDKINESFFKEVLPALTVDLITFEHEAWINGKKYIITTGKGNPNEQIHDGKVKRSPYTSDVWKRELVQSIPFPDTNYGEDYEWAKRAIENVDTEHHIDKVLHEYHYEDSVTAAIEVKRESKKKTCVISFSSIGRENYNQALLNMIDSVLSIDFETDFLLYSPDHELEEHKGIDINKGYPNCKTHQEIPYQFKPALFLEARRKGYEQVIWMDSTVKLLRHPQKALDYAGTNGITAYDNVGHPLRWYITKKAVENLGIHPQTLETLPQIMACVIVMDLTHTHVNEILDEWARQAEIGSFNDGQGYHHEFKSHRHDQAVLSYLIFKYGQKFVPYGQLCYPPHHETGDYEVIFLNKN